MTSGGNLLGPDPTLLPANDDAAKRLASEDPAVVAAAYPSYSAAWATLAEQALESGDAVTAYAYARTGYHRGLDQLRRAGWKGHGSVPWSHEPNRGFLRSLAYLGAAAAIIGEGEEASRCLQFLTDSDPAAVQALGLG